jgi:hypothetical protein
VYLFKMANGVRTFIINCKKGNLTYTVGCPSTIWTLHFLHQDAI